MHKVCFDFGVNDTSGIAQEVVGTLLTMDYEDVSVVTTSVEQMATASVEPELSGIPDISDVPATKHSFLGDKWKEAPDWAYYAAMDDEGTWYWFAGKPIMGSGYWLDEFMYRSFLHDFHSNWKQSLEEKPSNIR